ncbi:triple tyrosine motif-containing protein [Flavobacterium sp. LB3P122]|uniref:triple tyrosine motif-containing protein n=1 Tax=Flavobacterium algoriphilum TaxID=3398738 RepID=UPI003A85F98A
MEKKDIWIKKDNLIYRMTLGDDLKKFVSIRTYQNLSKTVKAIENIQQLENKIYFQTSNHFYRYSYEQNLFFEDKKMSNLFAKIPKTNTLTQDKYGNIWRLFGESLGVFKKTNKGDYKNIVATFSKLTGNIVHNNLSINTTGHNDTFIGLTDGLAHYAPNLLTHYEVKPKAYITGFSFPGDIFILGNGQKALDNYKIPYTSNHVKFTFSSPLYENLENLEFSYQLEGFDNQWSNWSTNIFKEYTNLKEGNYTMKLKARTNYGKQSEQTKLNFSISPPWYRHILAYLFYILLIVASVVFIRKRIKTKIRKNKYYETIEQRRLYLEKESKIRQEQYDLEKEIEKLKNDKLKIKISAKDKELVNNSFQVVKKNKILNGIIYKLKNINVESFDESTKFQFTKLNKRSKCL